ncbi:MAG: DUF697 domain-containing protein [Verrucomicrobia bacterium]|nr:DUF697 domain-containing protein [Verrucomicrobiota bacterium]
MNRQTLLSIYERLEGVISKLPGPLQNAVKGELSPIKQIFLAQRLARIVLVGKPTADASALLSGLLGSHLQMVEPQQMGGWVTYELRGRGGFQVLDARRLNETSLTWKALEAAISAESPDLFVFLVDGREQLDLGLECEQTARLLEMAELRHHSQAGLIGVVDMSSTAPQEVAETRRLELQTWLSGPGRLSAHFVKSVAVCSFVRFRVDGSIDPERDERRNLDVLGELLARELPGESQVEMARLVGAKKVQLETAQHLVHSLSTVCGAIGVQPIPFADFPILTALQFAMVSGIMHISGRELGLRSAAEFFGALGANIGAGMIFREGARGAAKLLPGWGNAISGGVAAMGTYAVGRAAIGYFIEGISIGEARKLFHRRKLPKVY